MKSHQLLILLAGYLALSPCVTAQDATEPPGVMISPGSAAGREPRVDYEAERTRATEALNELEAKYQGLESYHIQARKVGTVQRTRVEEATSVWKEHEPEQGARWRMELEIVRQIEERPPITTKTVNVSGHEESWTYTKTGEQARAVRSLPNQWNSHFDVLRRGLSAQINQVSMDEPEEVHGHLCSVFRITRGPDMRRTIQRYWICQETGLLMKETQEREGRTDESTYEVEKIEVNTPIDASVWEYEPPADVEVMDLRERQQAVPRPAPPTLPGL
jgi:outer membrane lipoprotein-sorting protein